MCQVRGSAIVHVGPFCLTATLQWNRVYVISCTCAFHALTGLLWEKKAAWKSAKKTSSSATDNASVADLIFGIFLLLSLLKQLRLWWQFGPPRSDRWGRTSAAASWLISNTTARVNATLLRFLFPSPPLNVSQQQLLKIKSCRWFSSEFVCTSVRFSVSFAFSLYFLFVPHKGFGRV